MATTRVILLLAALATLATGCDTPGPPGPIGGPTLDGGVGVRLDGPSVGLPGDGGAKLDAKQFEDASVPPPLGIDGGPI